jgi:mannan endo-1,4-beta-mannosidase
MRRIRTVPGVGMRRFGSATDGGTRRLRTAPGVGVRRHRAALLAVLLTALLAACSGGSSPAGGSAPGRSGSAGALAGGGSGNAPVVPYDVRPLLSPAGKYLGVAIDGAPASSAVVDAYAGKVGKRPNLIEFYAAWGDGFDFAGARSAWAGGALPMMAWEPFTPSLRQIADGGSDDYIRTFAAAVRDLNVPVAISLGHEMNGNWYPWGTQATSAADFVRAWRHVHDLFLDVGATTVIWVWNPNVVNPVPNVALRPLYPGDAYVDWVGVTGYYTTNGQHTFGSLFEPTLRSVRAFTRRPALIAETGAQQGSRKPADVADLFAGVAANKDVVGFVWFEYAKRADWRVTVAPAALAQYRKDAADPRFGFDPRHP